MPTVTNEALMSHKKTSESNIFVKKCIVEAFFSLLNEKDFNDISITEIIKKAGVSRMGFYRNYSSKSDLLEKFIQQCFDETIEELNEAGVKVLSITKTIEITLKYFQQYKSYMETLIKRDILYLLWKIYDKCFTEFFNINDATRFKTYSIKMFIGELFSLETEWVKSGMKESPEKLSRIFYRVLSQRVSLN